MDAYGDFQHRLAYHFKDQSLLERALTHRSSLQSVANGDAAESNERLEFLGDRVLGLSIAGLLYTAFPEESEGSLAKRFAALTSAVALERIAQTLGLSDVIQLGAAEHTVDRAKSTIAGNACEAIFGAVYLDGGFAAAQTLITTLWKPLIHETPEPPKDAKTSLQEWAQGRGLPLPKYRLIESEGPDHAPIFHMTVELPGFDPASGSGPSKREATQVAAAALLDQVT